MTITEFLLARIAEDEAAADRVEFRPYLGEGAPELLTARVLAECEAKRQIIELHQRCNVHDHPGDECDACQRCGDGSIWPCDTLLAVASVYADHPDFDPAWRAADA